MPRLSEVPESVQLEVNNYVAPTPRVGDLVLYFRNPADAPSKDKTDYNDKAAILANIRRPQQKSVSLTTRSGETIDNVPYCEDPRLEFPQDFFALKGCWCYPVTEADKVRAEYEKFHEMNEENSLKIKEVADRLEAVAQNQDTFLNPTVVDLQKSIAELQKRIEKLEKPPASKKPAAQSSSPETPSQAQ